MASTTRLWRCPGCGRTGQVPVDADPKLCASCKQRRAARRRDRNPRPTADPLPPSRAEAKPEEPEHRRIDVALVAILGTAAVIVGALVFVTLRSNRDKPEKAEDTIAQNQDPAPQAGNPVLPKRDRKRQQEVVQEEVVQDAPKPQAPPKAKPKNGFEEKPNPLQEEEQRKQRIAEFLRQSETYRNSGSFIWEDDRRKKYPIRKMSDKALILGKIGKIAWATSIKIVQVADKGSLLVSPILITPRAVPGSLTLRQTPHRGQPFFLDGMDTSQLSDGQSLSGSLVFKVIGTRSYTTVLGAKRTVAVLKRFDMSGLEPYLKQKLPKSTVKKPMPKPKQRQETYRRWSLLNGKQTPPAKLVGFQRGVAIFRTIRSTTLRISLRRLSREDQKRVKEAVAASRKKR